MAAAADEPKGTTLVLSGTDGAQLVVRRWTLEVIDGPDAGKTMTQDSGTIVIGTGESADFHLSDGTVSRAHAELRLLPEGVMVLDLGSRNGTRVGKVNIESTLLQPDGTVRLGHTTLRVVADDRSLPTAVLADSFGLFATANAAMKFTLAQLDLAAQSEATVLLEGETGCGKELLAQAIHAGSARAARPLVVVDCGAVAENLLESELFGHKKGSFTGAIEDRIGAIEAADGGTVFLDEIGELSLPLQPKLLRVLEARTIRRIGESTDRHIDVRFVAATNRSLERLAKTFDFRADLYYRLAVVKARIPPLRERPEDVPFLAAAFAKGLSGGKVELSPESIGALTRYDWPGNVRELRNVIERALALSRKKVLTPSDLFATEVSEEAQDARSFHDAKDRVVREFEHRYVKALLDRHGGKVSDAAKEAGISRPALYALMRRAGVEGKG